MVSEREVNLNRKIKHLTRDKEHLFKEIDYLARKVQVLQNSLDDKNKNLNPADGKYMEKQIQILRI